MNSSRRYSFNLQNVYFILFFLFFINKEKPARFDDDVFHIFIVEFEFFLTLPSVNENSHTSFMTNPKKNRGGSVAETDPISNLLRYPAMYKYATVDYCKRGC